MAYRVITRRKSFGIVHVAQELKHVGVGLHPRIVYEREFNEAEEAHYEIQSRINIDRDFTMEGR